MHSHSKFGQGIRLGNATNHTLSKYEIHYQRVSYLFIFGDMLSDFKILRFFDSSSLAIVELKRLGLPDSTPGSAIQYWLMLDKHQDKLSLIDLRSIDSSGEVEERFFDQGFLKYNTTEATFIEKFNSAQHRLDIRNTGDFPTEMLSKIRELI